MANFKTLGTKLSNYEADLVVSYCKRKGTTPNKFIKDLLLKEINISVPNNLAGRNIMRYNKETDTFSWSVLLDSNENCKVIDDMSPAYLESLSEIAKEAIKQRDFSINKKQKDSVAIPARMMRKK